VPIAFVLGALSAAIGVAVAMTWRAKQFLILAIVLNIAYWVLGEGFGGIFQGGATDPNAGPLFVLMAYVMYGLVRYRQPAGPVTEPTPAGHEVAVAG
jgi:ABC-type transport system involved in cytochrome c biogenesis permease component